MIATAAEAQSTNAADTAPIEYSARGTLTYLTGEPPVARFTREFELTVSNSDWDIRVDANDSKSVTYYELVHQSNCIYYYTYLGKLKMNAEPGPANNGIATIEQGDVPVEKGQFATYIWAGLASSWYLKHSPDRQVQPLWLAADIKTTKVKADWEYLDSPPGLPRHIIYYQKAGLLPPPFDSGWKAAELSVLSETNIDGFKMPRQFAYTQFKPKQGAERAEDLESQCTVDVTVQSARRISDATIGPPATHGITLVGEERFSPRPDLAVVYPSSAKNLPDTPESNAVEQYRYRAAILTGTTSPDFEQTRRNFWAKIGILAFFILSAGVFALMTKRTLKKTNNP